MQGFEILKLSSLLGANRNRSALAGEMQPSRLFNLTDARGGGYTPQGAWDGTALVALGLRSLIGFDDMGLSSWALSGAYSLYEGEGVLVDQTAAAYASTDRTAHIPGLGAYRRGPSPKAQTAKDGQFLVLDRGGNKVEPFSYAPSFDTLERGKPAAEEGGSGTTSDLRGAAFDFTNKRWVVVGAGGTILTRLQSATTWTAAASGTANDLYAVDHDGVTWVAVGAGGTVLTSPDGTNWTARTSGVTQPLWGVKGNGSLWVAVGSNKTLITSPGITSLDEMTWTTRTTGIGVNCKLLATDYSTTLGMWMVSSDGYDDYTIGHPYHWGAPFAYSTDGSTWTASQTGSYREMHGLTSSPGGWVSIGHRTNKDRFAVITSSQGTSNTWREHLYPGGIRDASQRWWFVLYNTVTKTWIAGGNRQKLLSSRDGFNWTAATFDGSEDDAANWYAAAFDDQGAFMIVGSGGQVIESRSGSKDELQSGDYEIAWLSYVNTDAGKLVVDLGIKEMKFAGLETTKVTVSAPASATPNLFTEIYVRSSEREKDDLTGDFVVDDISGEDFIHAKTLEPGDEWEMVVPTVGRVLPLQGAVGTCGSGGSMAVEHGGRVWMVMSENPTDFEFLKKDADVGALGGHMTIGYTLLGYANLVSVLGFLPMPASQSTVITGAISTPSGLLVFGDNETFLVSGDEALGGFSVDLYPDIVGMDAGTLPTKMGGVPFVIWKGRVWALEGGRAVDVSKDVYLESDKFVKVATESSSRSIMAVTAGGVVLRYRVDTGFWHNDIGDGRSPTEILPHPDGVRYVVGGSVYKEAVSGVDLPELEWRNVDAGDAQRRDTWVAARFTVSNYTVDPINPPRLYYRVSQGQSDVSLKPNGQYVVGRQREEEVTFKLPWGLKSRRADFLIEWRNAAASMVIEPGPEFFYSSELKGAQRAS
jgi:hypothetical protein